MASHVGDPTPRRGNYTTTWDVTLPTEAQFHSAAVTWAAEEAEVGSLRNLLHVVNRLAVALLLTIVYAIPGAAAVVLAVEIGLAVFILFAYVIGAIENRRRAPYLAKYGPVDGGVEEREPEQTSDEGHDWTTHTTAIYD